MMKEMNEESAEQWEEVLRMTRRDALLRSVSTLNRA